MIDGEIKPLWHCSYWDGPLSGIALYQGRKHAFDMLSDREWGDEDPDDDDSVGELTKPRMYNLYALTDEQIAVEERRQQAFRDYCGDHTDYGEDGKRTRFVPRREDWREFYKLEFPKLALDPAAIVGVVSEDALWPPAQGERG